MKSTRCPRCDEPIRGRFPVHLACFLERSYPLILSGLGCLFIPVCVICVVLSLVVVKLQSSQGYSLQTSPSATSISAVARPTPNPIAFEPTKSVLPTPVSQRASPLPTQNDSPTPEPTDTTGFFGTVTGTLNLREGPGQSYSIVDKLSKGTNVVILGRNSTGTWFKVTVPNSSLQGWISKDYVDSNVSLDLIPPTDEPTPPPTATRPLRTATPLPPKGVVINYYADQDNISPGSCTVLHWGVEGVKEIYLDGSGVQGWDQRRVCPNATTTYTLRIVLKDGSSVERRVVVRVQ